MSRRLVRSAFLALASVLVAGAGVGCSSPKGASSADKRQYVDREVQQTLEAFYEQEPALRERVEQAPGYGVFSSIGTNVLLVSTDGGYGKVVNEETGEETYMRMAGGGLGIGIGAKDYRQLMIYHTADALQRFVESGWTATAEADAAAQSGDQGGEASGAGEIRENVEIHTLTKNGLSLSATVQGVRYWKDEGLNAE